MAWGALMGLGKGVSGVGDLIGEKRNRDWEAQQNNIKYERAEALERLRKQNNLEVQKAGFANQQELYKTKLADTTSRDIRLREEGREDYNTQLEAKTAAEKDLYKYKQDAELQGVKDQFKAKIDIKNQLFDEYMKEAGGKFSPEEVLRQKAAFVYEIPPEKMEKAKAPTDAIWKASESLFNNLLLEGKVTPEQGPSWIKQTAYGLAADPSQTRSSLEEFYNNTDSSMGKYTSSDAKELARMSDEEAAQELQGIREREGEDVWRSALADVREAKKKPEPSSGQSALSGLAKSVYEFGTRDRRDRPVAGNSNSPPEGLNAQQQYEWWVNKKQQGKPAEKTKNQYGY